jgi:sirohydrochlorin cobaltochelatase
MTDKRLVLLAHGSKDTRWQLPFNELTTVLKERLGADAVCLAYVEFIPPTVSDVAGEAVRDGKRELLVLPMFLAAGAHLAEDVPAQVTEARSRFPQLQIELLPPIGEHARVRRLFQEIVCEYAGASKKAENQIPC